MGWYLLGVVVVGLLVGGGLYQVVTGRYVGIGRFAAAYDPSPRVVRVAGGAGIFAGVCMILLWIGLNTGAIHAE